MDLTQQAYDKLKKELKYLETVKRKEIAEQLRHAASFGDFSENAAYDDAKDSKSFLEGKILELKEIIKKSRVVKGDKLGKVQIGSRVVLKSDKEEINLEIVPPTDIDAGKGKISYESPFGKALMNKRKGDAVEINTPSGIIRYKIKEIT